MLAHVSTRCQADISTWWVSCSGQLGAQEQGYDLPQTTWIRKVLTNPRIQKGALAPELRSAGISRERDNEVEQKDVKTEL